MTQCKIKTFLVGLFFVSMPALAQEVTHYEVAKNFAVDIKGKYPAGYEPKWKYFGTRENVDLKIQDYVAGRQVVFDERKALSFGEYEGKMVLLFSAFISCDCIADLSIPGGGVTLSSTPQKFKLSNFRKTTDGSPCGNASNMYVAGGYGGDISFAANENGDMTANLVLETYRKGDRWSSAGVSYRYTADLAIPNQMTPAMAYANIDKKNKAEQDALDREKNERAKKAERERLDKAYAEMLKKVKAMPAANPKTILTYKGYPLKDFIKLNVLIGTHDCVERTTHADTFRNEIKKSELNIDQEWVQDIYAKIFPTDISKIEPHDRDGKFAMAYLFRRRYNELVIETAARYRVCDLEKVKELTKFSNLTLRNLIDTDEYVKMVQYLESKP